MYCIYNIQQLILCTKWLIRGSVLNSFNTVILAPGAREVGLGAAALAPLCAHTARWRHWRLNSARSLFVRRHAT